MLIKLAVHEVTTNWLGMCPWWWFSFLVSILIIAVMFIYLLGVRLHGIDRRKLEKKYRTPRIVDTALNI